MHVAWSRIQEASLTAKPLPFYKQRLKMASRGLEREFGLTRVPNERQSSISYAPTRAEEQQARRLGVDLHATRETIRECFERSDCGRSFQSALAHAGLTLARGDRRDFLVVDWVGGMHALGKRILDVPAAEIRARLADLTRDRLPTIEEARRSILTRQGPKRAASVVPRRKPLVPDLAPKPQTAGTSRDDLEQAQIESHIEPRKSTIERAGARDEQEFGPAPTTGRAQHEPPVPEVPAAVPESPVVSARNERPHGFSDLLKRQFRALVKALTKRAPSPQPQGRRRRSGETAGAFRLAARNILRPITRLPVIQQTTVFLKDTLAWLHLWDWNQNSIENEASQAPGCREDDHLSPHL
jgi:hypothetical protein